VDVERFTPNNSTRQQLREAWNIEKDAFLIGFVGRLDPMKDLHTFLAAASLVASQSGKSTFVCVGKGLTADVPEQRATQEKYGLGNRIIWAGVRDDMPAIYNSLDLLVSSSYGEGFSNVIAEAMACGVPCVVTDVGDSALIVGETGILVPPQSPEALADGVVAMLNKPGFLDGTLKSACRMRIVENFTTERLIENTTVLFNKLLCSE
jgi:glycosyltransferase involved in cell wall biosynthesis